MPRAVAADFVCFDVSAAISAIFRASSRRSSCRRCARDSRRRSGSSPSARSRLFVAAVTLFSARRAASIDCHRSGRDWRSSSSQATADRRPSSSRMERRSQNAEMYPASPRVPVECPNRLVMRLPSKGRRRCHRRKRKSIARHYQSPNTRHHAAPTPIQIAMLMTLTIAPTRHHMPSDTWPLPKRIGAGAVP